MITILEIQFQNLLNALDNLKNTNIIFTKANADTQGRIINKMIDNYVNKNKNNSISFFSMGQLKYLSTLQYVDSVIGDDQALSGFVVNNTGNVNLTNITIEAYDLTGVQFPAMLLPADYFSANAVDNPSTATALVNGQEIQVPNLDLSIQSEASVYFYADIPEDTFPQVYHGIWFVGIG